MVVWGVAGFDLLPDGSSLLYCFQVGIGAGILIVTTLSFFPGEPLGIVYGKQDDDLIKHIAEYRQQISSAAGKFNNDSINPNANKNNTGDTTTMTMTTTQETSDATLEEHNQQSSPMETIPRSTLKQIQQRYHWSDEQMKHVLETYRQQKREDHHIAPPVQGGWTPHQKLNFIVYIIMITVMVYVVNQEYGNFFSVLMAQFFPREAKLLGITIPIESTSPNR